MVLIKSFNNCRYKVFQLNCYNLLTFPSVFFASAVSARQKTLQMLTRSNSSTVKPCRIYFLSSYYTSPHPLHWDSSSWQSSASSPLPSGSCSSWDSSGAPRCPPPGSFDPDCADLAALRNSRPPGYRPDRHSRRNDPPRLWAGRKDEMLQNVPGATLGLQRWFWKRIDAWTKLLLWNFEYSWISLSQYANLKICYCDLMVFFLKYWNSYCKNCSSNKTLRILGLKKLAKHYILKINTRSRNFQTTFRSISLSQKILAMIDGSGEEGTVISCWISPTFNIWSHTSSFISDACAGSPSLYLHISSC